MKNNKIMKFALKHIAAITACALVLAFGIGYWALSQVPTATSIGNDIIVVGNVGIGTTGLSEKLTVLGTGGVGGWIALSSQLPGYPSDHYPTLKTDYTNLYFSAGGAYSAYMNTAGTWTAMSDRNIKENFIELNPQEILTKIDQLPMYQWNFKNEDSSIKHIAPVAQDFYALFGLNGNNDKMISNIDPSGVALVGIKALSEKVKAQQQEIEQLKAGIESLEARLNIGQ